MTIGIKLQRCASDRNDPLRDVLKALALKLGLLACLYWLFFSPAHRPSSDASATYGALMSSGALMSAGSAGNLR